MYIQVNGMNGMNKVDDDETDLFELFQTLWDGKWYIATFVAIAVLLGGGFISTTGSVYMSKLAYSVDNIPPFLKKDSVISDFQKKFHSISVFEDWKNSSSKVSLVFENFSNTEVVDGFVISKPEGDLATLKSEKNGDLFVIINTNELKKLDDFFKYTNHINELLKNEYVAQAKDEIKITESLIKDLKLGESSEHLSLHRFIVLADKGASVFQIQHPTMPKKVRPKSILILAFSVVLGGMIGVFFVFVRNAKNKRKENLAKA